MVFNSITARAAAVLPLIGITLALANWTARPDRAKAWAAAIAVLAVMAIVRYGLQFAFRRSQGDASSARNFASVIDGVVFGSLMMIIPLAVKLAQAYGFVDDPDSGRRATMITFGVYFAAFGNTLPRMLPPVASMSCNGARVQAFQRFAGWTWVLCGLGFATAWLALPIDTAHPVSMALMVGAMTVTVVQLLRLRAGYA